MTPPHRLFVLGLSVDSSAETRKALNRLGFNIDNSACRTFTTYVAGYTICPIFRNQDTIRVHLLGMSFDGLAAEQLGQLALRLAYRDCARRNAPLPVLFETEFRAYSQNGEDGILWFLFSLLGTTNRRAVEICAGAGVECNAANLIIHHGWSALLVDGDDAQLARGREFYRQCRSTWVAPPLLAYAWVTAENVNDIVAGNGFAGEVDLLSLDLDGNDYWIWNALTVVRPRVVVLEFNGTAGPDRRVTIKYDPAFRPDFSITPYRVGASLAAFTALAARKGYRLVGVQSLGFNAFFVRDDIPAPWLRTRTPHECYAETPRLRDWHPAQLEELLTGTQAWDEV